MQKTIILASQSKQRKALMETLHIPFTVMPAHIDEQAITHPNPVVRAQKIAEAKAFEVLKKWKASTSKEAVIIAADTYSFKGNILFEKPSNKAQAIEMITTLSGKTSVTVTGFCMIDTQSERKISDTVETIMNVRELSKKEIEQYVSTNQVTKWSGGFSPAYHAGAALFDSINGSLTSFSHGFPMEKIIPILKEMGVEI